MQSLGQNESVKDYLKAQEDKSLLRFITCGSVDDGKSTLIGRMLYDSKLVFEDQLEALGKDSKKSGSSEAGVNLALLVDGLAAEREQGITIDVAYRFFSTDLRKFIVADTPGHEQYTRNMATGASNADLAVVLVDATKGVLTQTKRHSFIISLMGIKHVLLCINKMDLVENSQDVYKSITGEYEDFAKSLGITSVVSIPISALSGDNVLNPSQNMKWYSGPTVIKHLETVDVKENTDSRGFRMPVQWVNRPNMDFRGFSGLVASGQVSPGDEVVVLPSGTTTKIKSIVMMNGDLETAAKGQSITLTLQDEVDASRGNVISSLKHRPAVSDQFLAKVIWMSDQALLPGRPYIFKTSCQTVPGVVSELKHKVNVNTLEHEAGKKLELNEVGVCNLAFDKRIVFEPYDENPTMGSFIIIDRLSNETVGAGTIDYGLHRAANVHWQALDIDKSARAEVKSQTPKVIWFTGLSGSGKSTVANIVEQKMLLKGKHTYLLDGDNVRHGLNKDLGFTDEDRVENIRRVGEVAKLMADAGLIVLVSFISPFKSERRMVRNMLEDGEFIEVYVDTPLEVCEERDVKGLYKKARAGEIKNFTGIDSTYEEPTRAEIRVETATHSAEECAEKILKYIEGNDQ